MGKRAAYLLLLLLGQATFLESKLSKSRLSGNDGEKDINGLLLAVEPWLAVRILIVASAEIDPLKRHYLTVGKLL